MLQYINKVNINSNIIFETIIFLLELIKCQL